MDDHKELHEECRALAQALIRSWGVAGGPPSCQMWKLPSNPIASVKAGSDILITPAHDCWTTYTVGESDPMVVGAILEQLALWFASEDWQAKAAGCVRRLKAVRRALEV